jgi:hypothetical protein
VGVTHVEGGQLGSAEYTPEALGSVEFRSGDRYDGAVPQRTLELAAFAISVLLLVRFGPSAVRSLRIFAGVRTRRMTDAGPDAIAPPAPVAEMAEELHGLGFRRLGERFLRLNGVLRYEWLLTDDATTYISVVESRVVGALVACYSAFADGAWVQTNYPRGEVIERPDYVARFARTGVGDALVIHRKNIERLRPLHGDPRAVRTMADAQELDAEYRSRHGGVTLRRLTVLNVMPGLAAAALTLISGTLLLLSR